MFRQNLKLIILTMVVAMLGVGPVMGQNITRDYDDGYDDYNTNRDYGDRARIDRYLAAEIWTNHNDGEYYEGDEIVIHYRVNRDAYVVIYSVDTRGRVNLLFPTDPYEDNFVEGGVTHHLPGRNHDFELVVNGPDGVENIQIIASRESIPVPDWYPVSGLVCDWDDCWDFMDYVNDRHFVRYPGQRMAYDRTAIYVEEFEEYYFQPVYHPVFHSWTMAGNVYVDYPFGSSVYVNGIYWGCTPLYLPRIWVGWHTFTVYDHWGHCWETDIHITRHHTVVLDHNVINVSPRVQSKYKEVRVVGYRDPVRSGYSQFEARKKAILSASGVTKKNVVRGGAAKGSVASVVVPIGPKKKLRGSQSLVKTDRGWESIGPIGQGSSRAGSRGKSPRQSVTIDKGQTSGGGGQSRNDGNRSSRITSSPNSGGSSKAQKRGSWKSEVGRKLSGNKQSSGSGRTITKRKITPQKGKSTSKKSQPQVNQKKSSSKQSSKSKSGTVKPKKSSSGSKSGGKTKSSKSSSDKSGKTKSSSGKTKVPKKKG